jgi:hypothetical protein
MTLEVTLSNGNVIYPSFDPAVLEGVAAYYNEQYRIGFVKSWKVL